MCMSVNSFYSFATMRMIALMKNEKSCARCIEFLFIARFLIDKRDRPLSWTGHTRSFDRRGGSHLFFLKS